MNAEVFTYFPLLIKALKRETCFDIWGDTQSTQPFKRELLLISDQPPSHSLSQTLLFVFTHIVGHTLVCAKIHFENCLPTHFVVANGPFWRVPWKWWLSGCFPDQPRWFFFFNLWAALFKLHKICRTKLGVKAIWYAVVQIIHTQWCNAVKQKCSLSLFKVLSKTWNRILKLYESH